MISAGIFRIIRYKFALLCCLLTILFLAGCSTEPEDCAGVTGGSAVEDCNGICNGDAQFDECEDTWTIIIEDILSPRCTSCHTSGTYFAQLSGLVLTPDSAYAQLIDAPTTNIYANQDGLTQINSEGGMYAL